ncbi:MAG: adenine phosphoribosyltransferase [Planctomycetia bacterium]|nr:adenine phosphoribosyltransferase [Planctomycetia bacterium]
MHPLTQYVRSIPDFPKPGIIFRDIVPLIENPVALKLAIETLKEAVEPWGPFDKIAAPEARGFIFAAPLAIQLNAGLAPMRKPGKLPFKTVSIDYSLEYGVNSIEMHEDTIKSGDRVLLLDDLLATGGTINACRKLIERQGGIVKGAAFIIELVDLKGRDTLGDLPVFAPVQFEGE